MAGFQKATKKQAKARIALDGPSGAGKTWTGLQTAIALADGKPVAVIDSEQGSASLYADLFDFDVLEISGDYNPRRYIDGITEAAKAGYGALLIDSLSHAWAGSGGVLELVDAAKTRFGGNSYMAWSVGTPAWQALIDAILGSPLHVVATIRSKSKFVEQDKGGRKTYERVGTEPVARDGIEFEFTIVGDLDLDHNLVISKSRCHLVPPGKVFRQPKADLADAILEWLNSGAVDVKARARELTELAGEGNKAALTEALREVEIGLNDLADDDTFDRAKALALALKVQSEAVKEANETAPEGGETAGQKPSDPPHARPTTGRSGRSADPDLPAGAVEGAGEAEGEMRLGAGL